MPRTRQGIPLALAVAALLACAPAAAEPLEPDLERAVATAVNRHREKHGLAPLDWSPAAAELAREHSCDMAAGRVGFGHDGFEERSRSLRAELGISQAAENVWRQSRPAASAADAALAQWLASPTHRRNIERPFELAGVGACRSADGTLYLTQIFVGSAKRAAPEVGGARRASAKLIAASAKRA